MQLFWCPNTRAQRVAWLLEETGLDYSRVTIDIQDPAARSDPAFAAASPMGKVPALVDGAVRMADSAAICIYLADRYPACGLAPAADHPQRGAYLYWMLYTPGVIEPALAERFNEVPTNRASSGWGDFDTMIETLTEGVAEGPWILGDRFSAADVMLGSSVHFMQAFGLLAALPALEAYGARCSARPACQRALAMEAPDAALP